MSQCGGRVSVVIQISFRPAITTTSSASATASKCRQDHALRASVVRLRHPATAGTRGVPERGSSADGAEDGGLGDAPGDAG
jgi:hypothetical protein